MRETKRKPETKTELLEKLAALEHEQWASWIDYQIRFGDIPKEYWRRKYDLAQTSYEKLTEEQKEQDRVWTRKVLRVSEAEHRKGLAEKDKQIENLSLFIALCKKSSEKMETEHTDMRLTKQALEGENAKLKNEIAEERTGNEFLNTENLALMGDCVAYQKRLEAIRQPHSILCLVGSTSPDWKARYRHVLVELTKKSYICQTVVWFKDELENFETHRELLESIHFQKVRMAEAVVLIHKDAVGKHTTMEMDYAKSLKIPVVTFSTIEETSRELGVLLSPKELDQKTREGDSK